MSKSRTTKRDRHRGPVAPQVFSMARAASNRVQKLLALCETRILAMTQKASNPNTEVPIRELQAVVRMTLTLQKEWDKYAAVLYPSTEPVLPASSLIETPKVEKHSEKALKDKINKTNLLLQDSVSALVQDLEALQAGGFPAVLNRGIPKPFEKKQAKAEKFSQAFFQKRVQTTTL